LTTDTPAAASYRYGAVFFITLVTVVFVIAVPNADWSRATVIALDGLALVVAVATGRDQKLRGRRAVAVAIATVVVVAAVAAGVLPRQVTSAVLAVATAAVPAVIVGGLVRLVRQRGVTLQAVAGALAIYLSLGLVFAWIVSFVAQVDSAPYFAQNTSGTAGDRVYYSFAVLTTTGFGDFTAAHPAGHALAVIEMLVGQVYLVTVISLLIGNFGRQSTTM
jgi:hypothetical protein